MNEIDFETMWNKRNKQIKELMCPHCGWETNSKNPTHKHENKIQFWMVKK